MKARTKELCPSARFEFAKKGWPGLAAKKAGCGGSGTLTSESADDVPEGVSGLRLISKFIERTEQAEGLCHSVCAREASTEQ